MTNLSREDSTSIQFDRYKIFQFHKQKGRIAAAWYNILPQSSRDFDQEAHQKLKKTRIHPKCRSEEIDGNLVFRSVQKSYYDYFNLEINISNSTLFKPNSFMFIIKLHHFRSTQVLIGLRDVSGFDAFLFILENIRICCKLEIQVRMAIEQG